MYRRQYIECVIRILAPEASDEDVCQAREAIDLAITNSGLDRPIGTSYQGWSRVYSRTCTERGIELITEEMCQKDLEHIDKIRKEIIKHGKASDAV